MYNFNTKRVICFTSNLMCLISYRGSFPFPRVFPLIRRKADGRLSEKRMCSFPVKAFRDIQPSAERLSLIAIGDVSEDGPFVYVFITCIWSRLCSFFHGRFVRFCRLRFSLNVNNQAQRLWRNSVSH